MFAVSVEAFAGVEGRTWANNDDKYLSANFCRKVLCRRLLFCLVPPAPVSCHWANVSAFSKAGSLAGAQPRGGHGICESAVDGPNDWLQRRPEYHLMPGRNLSA